MTLGELHTPHGHTTPGSAPCASAGASYADHPWGDVRPSAIFAADFGRSITGTTSILAGRTNGPGGQRRRNEDYGKDQRGRTGVVRDVAHP